MRSSIRLYAARVFVLCFLAWILPPASALAACLELGGREFCGNQRPATRWSIDACDEAAPFTGRRAAWCTARGGTWNGSDCVNPASHTDGNVVQHSVAFAQTFWNDSSCALTSDTGYGITIPSSWCTTGGDLYEIGELKSTKRRHEVLILL